MGLLDNNTSYNPLYLENATGLEADFDEVVLEDDTDEMLKKNNKSPFEDWEEDENDLF